MQFIKGSLTGAHRWNALFHGCPQAGVIFFNFVEFCYFMAEQRSVKCQMLLNKNRQNKWNNGVMCYIHTHRDTQMFG